MYFFVSQVDRGTQMITDYFFCPEFSNFNHTDSH